MSGATGGLPPALDAGADLVGWYLRGVAEHLVSQPGITMRRRLAEVYRRCGS